MPLHGVNKRQMIMQACTCTDNCGCTAGISIILQLQISPPIFLVWAITPREYTSTVRPCYTIFLDF